MEINAAGLALLASRGVDESARQGVESRLFHALGGAPTSENQFSALAVCACSFGLQALLASELMAAHREGRKDRICELWVSPFMTDGGKFTRERDRERALYLTPEPS
jgi:GH24 family phage-related lysozyme (muramidase)